MFKRDVRLYIDDMEEAIANIPDEVKNRAPSIEWRLIKDFRNFIVHEYFGLDSRIVWDAVRKELPTLKAEVARLRNPLEKTKENQA